MNKIELYCKLGMDKYFVGNSFEYDIRESNICIFDVLDEICLLENLTPLHDAWNQLSFLECERLLRNAFRFDIAYPSSQKMLEEEATCVVSKIINRINIHNSKFFTNWFENPWEGNSGATWNSITQSTFDMAIVLVDSEKVVFTYFISED